jgi:hypothetical protein
MTDEYIDNNYELIVSHGSDIEYRGDDVDCKKDNLKKDNRNIIEGYRKVGEQITLIDKDYEKTVQELTDKLKFMERNNEHNV